MHFPVIPLEQGTIDRVRRRIVSPGKPPAQRRNLGSNTIDLRRNHYSALLVLSKHLGHMTHLEMRQFSSQSRHFCSSLSTNGKRPDVPNTAIKRLQLIFNRLKKDAFNTFVCVLLSQRYRGKNAPEGVHVALLGMELGFGQVRSHVDFHQENLFLGKHSCGHYNCLFTIKFFSSTFCVMAMSNLRCWYALPFPAQSIRGIVSSRLRRTSTIRDLTRASTDL